MYFPKEWDYNIWKTDQQTRGKTKTLVHLYFCDFSHLVYLQLYFYVWQPCRLQYEWYIIFIMLITYVHQFSCPYMLGVVCKYSVTKSRAWHFHRKCLLWNFSLEVCFSLQLWSIWHPQSYISNNGLQLN